MKKKSKKKGNLKCCYTLAVVCLVCPYFVYALQHRRLVFEFPEKVGRIFATTFRLYTAHTQRLPFLAPSSSNLPSLPLPSRAKMLLFHVNKITDDFFERLHVCETAQFRKRVGAQATVSIFIHTKKKGQTRHHFSQFISHIFAKTSYFILHTAPTFPYRKCKSKRNVT